MARIEDIERRLLNWARWKHGAGAGGLGYASVNYMALTGEDRDQGAEPAIPTFDCEASETDGAVMALPSELRATVEVVYVLGGGMATKARRLAVSEATVWARVARAHPLIEAWVYDKAAKRRELQAELQRRMLAARSQRA